jgi:hypothetical protein
MASCSALGGTLSVAQHLPGRAGDALVEVGHQSFVRGMGMRLLIAACVVALAACVVTVLTANWSEPGGPTGVTAMTPPTKFITAVGESGNPRETDAVTMGVGGGGCRSDPWRRSPTRLPSGRKAR